VLGCCAFGVKITRNLFSSQHHELVEGKLSILSPSADSRVILGMKQFEDRATLSCGVLYNPTYSKAFAAKVILSPGKSTFAENVHIEVAAANQITADTMVKTRYFSAQNAVGFSFAHLLSRKILVEFGTDIPLSAREGAKFSLKLLCS
jgi:hypothetical protein